MVDLLSAPQSHTSAPLMKPILRFTSLAILCLIPAVVSADNAKHLFILSGQSNMAGHRPDEAFTPAVSKALGAHHVIVVQDAVGGQPILRWYKAWKSPSGEHPEKTGDLYDRLLKKVNAAIKGHDIQSVTLIWMQGERDAKMKWGSVYEQSLRGLHQQLSDDLNRSDIRFVIGRLSDYDMQNRVYVDWTKIREIQVAVADSNSNFAWVDCDDLNDGVNRKGKAIKNDLHYSADGYKKLGERFAAAALKMLPKSTK